MARIAMQDNQKRSAGLVRSATLYKKRWGTGKQNLKKRQDKKPLGLVVRKCVGAKSNE